MRYSALPSLMLAGALAIGAAACERDARRTEPSTTPGATSEPARGPADATREAARDAGGAVGTAGKTAAGAVETVDVKAALMKDDGVDASDINVDTDGVKKVVLLKGSVTTAAQKNRAEQIAMREAQGYRVDNQLVIRAR